MRVPDPLDALLAEVRERGARLDLVAGQARLNGPADAVSPDLLARLRQAKPAVLAHLARLDAELAELVEDLAYERTWLAERRLLLPGDGTEAELRAHFAELRKAQGLPAAVAEVRRHYAAAVACQVVPIRPPDAPPRIPRPTPSPLKVHP